MNAPTVDTKLLTEVVYELFRTMIGTTLTHGAVAPDRSQPASADVIGLIGMSGTVQATVGLRFTEHSARAIIGQMVGCQFETVDEAVIDGVGELVNIVAGRAKVAVPGVSISLPMVVRGDICHPTADPMMIQTEVCFTSGLGSFCLLSTYRLQPELQREVLHARAGR